MWDADLSCQQLGVSEWNEPPPETEPAKRDASPFGHIGLGLGLDVDDAADAVAVKVLDDTSLPVEQDVGGEHGGSFWLDQGDCSVLSLVMTAMPPKDYGGTTSGLRPGRDD
jgi:hypothetical protein